jgi:hypothetical protein
MGMERAWDGPVGTLTIPCGTFLGGTQCTPNAGAKFKKGALIERSCDLAEPRCVVCSPIARTQVAADSAPQTSEQYFSPSDTSRQRVRLDTARLGTPLAPHVSSSLAARTGLADHVGGGGRGRGTV